jgi:hypothetical protein
MPTYKGPVTLVFDLRIDQDRFGSSSDLNLNGHLHYPNDIDKSLNESASDKIRKCRSDYNNNPTMTVAFITVIACTSWRLHSEFVRLLFLQGWSGSHEGCSFTYYSKFGYSSHLITHSE